MRNTSPKEPFFVEGGLKRLGLVILIIYGGYFVSSALWAILFPIIKSLVQLAT